MSLVFSQSGEHYLTFDDVAHSYTLDGRVVPGVTGVNKAYPANFRLQQWLTKQGAWYVIEQLKLCPEQVSRLPNYLLDEIVKKSLQAGKKKAQEAADIGSITHDYAEADGNQDTEKLDQLRAVILEHPDKEKIDLCVREYNKWAEASKYELIDAEQIIASVKYQYAGKYDRLVKHRNKVILIDFKTSSGIWVEHKIQVGGAYRQALKEWRDIEIAGIDLVRFGKDGKFEHELITRKALLDEYRDQFLRNLDTHHFRSKHES